MIVLRHAAGETVSEAAFSPCGRYRYRLARRWAAGAALTFLLLNPSSADERRNDPTLARCERRARALGFPGLVVVNLFAFRSADPQRLRAADDPVGPENDRAIQEAAGAGPVLCAWGDHGALAARDTAVLALLVRSGADLWHLGLTRRGAPRHPLYLSAAVRPQRWRPELRGICLKSAL